MFLRDRMNKQAAEIVKSNAGDLFAASAEIVAKRYNVHPEVILMARKELAQSNAEAFSRTSFSGNKS